MIYFKRGNRGVIADYKIKDLYKHYCNTAKNPQSKQVFKRVLQRIYPEIIKMIVFENMEFYFPGRLGSIRIKKKLAEVKLTEEGGLDVRSLSIDWKKTKSVWAELYPGVDPKDIKQIKDKPLVRELNEHTDGWRYIWHWDKFISNIPNQRIYDLELIRDYKRILNKAATTINDLNYYK